MKQIKKQSLLFVFLILALGSLCVVINQNASATDDEIISGTIEINSNTTNGPDLSNTDYFGQSIANIGDLNGDGISDIAVGASGDDTGGDYRGAIYVLFMNHNGTVSHTIEINSNTPNGPDLNDFDYFGSSITNIGDLNNDGISDIAVGGTGGTLGGTVHIMLMNSNGTVSRTMMLDNNTANGPVVNEYDYFGQSIANIGDLNGDGISDIAVGAVYDDGSSTHHSANRGAMHIMFMNHDGTISRTIEINDATANGPTLNDSDYFGQSIANIGDLNGDGVPDIAVGESDDGAGATYIGTIQIMFMNSDGTISDIMEINDTTTNGLVLNAGDNFGRSIANIGDLNNDGVTDIAVGSNGNDAGGTNRGSIYIMLLNSNGTVFRTMEINSNTSNGPDLNNGDQFGTSIANIGDLNNDGVTDIAVGANYGGGGSGGAIHLVFLNSIDTTAPTITNITSNATIFGALKVSDTVIFTLTPGSAEDDATINGTYNSVPLFWNSTDNGTTYTADYTVSEGDMDQTAPLQITDVTITDDSNNTSMPFNGTDILKTIDANAPVITNITSDATSSGVLKVNDTITFTLTSDSAEVGDVIRSIYNLQPLSWSVANNGTAYTTTYVITDGMPDQTEPLQITDVTITDDAGNTSLPFNGTDILKTIDANAPTFVSSMINEGTGIFTIMFDQLVDISVVNPTGLSIREAGTTTGGITLSNLDLIQTSNDRNVLFTLNASNLELINALTAPRLNIDTGAVRDILGNAIIASADNAITLIDPISPEFSSSALNEETGILEITFTEVINVSEINVTKLSIRENNTNTGGVTLSISELNTTINDRIISFTLTEDNRQSVIVLATPQLDIDVAAVYDVAGNPIAASADNPIIVTKIPPPPLSCNVSDSGDWIITSSCILSENSLAVANVLIQNNAVLIIPDGFTLDIDFVNNNLTIESGSGVLIESGGTIT